jgi:energy-coupling factor transport system substrate-specific component
VHKRHYMETYNKNWLKFILGFIICFLIRLIPFRPPNIEPILATQMPFSKVYGATIGFLFAFLSIVLFDVFTGSMGVWTLLTASTYGVLGFWATSYFKKHEANAWGYARFAIMGTLFFDAVTGLSIGPLFFNQSFMGALVGQIPFTALHLLGNVSFAILLSPIIYRYVIENKNLETDSIINIFNPKRV